MIKAPWYSPEEDAAFTGYAAEIEARNKFIKEIAAAVDPDKIMVALEIADRLGNKIYDLNVADLEIEVDIKYV